MIEEYFENHLKVLKDLSETSVADIEAMVAAVVEAVSAGNKLLIMGNGGSAADAQHFAAEMVGRFQLERQAIPAIALTTDTSILTAVGNDYGFDTIFSRQVEALACPGDVVLGISTSGNSNNVLLAMEKARERGCRLLCLSGRDGGDMAKMADLTLVVPSKETPHIQEAHLTVIHLMCKLIEERLARGAQS